MVAREIQKNGGTRLYYWKFYKTLLLILKKQMIEGIIDDLQTENIRNEKLIERFVRITLGQTEFSDINTRENTFITPPYIKPNHLRFDFDARNDQKQIEHNQHIFDLFYPFYHKDKKVIVHSHKGFICVIIVNLEQYKLWKLYDVDMNDLQKKDGCPPFLDITHYPGEPTVQIICKTLQFFTQ